jgi:hypothetical protein
MDRRDMRERGKVTRGDELAHQTFVVVRPGAYHVARNAFLHPARHAAVPALGSGTRSTQTDYSLPMPALRLVAGHQPSRRRLSASRTPMRVLHRINELPWAKIIRCQCVITMIIGSLSSAGAFTRKRCPSGGGLWEKILLSTTLLRAQRQMADFGADGQQPIWARNGRGLFYLDGNALIAVERGRTPTEKRFVVNQLGEEPTVQTPITVITNWRATLRWHGELTRLAPGRKGLQQ